jgi:hypothetical protein
MAALAMPFVAAVNRFDAAAWYSGLRPHYWRDRLAASGVRITPTRVGDDGVPDDWWWMPYTTGASAPNPGHRAAAVMAAAFHPPATYAAWPALSGHVAPDADANIGHAARLLDTWGVRLAVIDADRDGRVHLVRVLPIFEDAATRAGIAAEVGRQLHDHCTAR